MRLSQLFVATFGFLSLTVLSKPIEVRHAIRHAFFHHKRDSSSPVETRIRTVTIPVTEVIVIDGSGDPVSTTYETADDATPTAPVVTTTDVASTTDAAPTAGSSTTVTTTSIPAQTASPSQSTAAPVSSTTAGPVLADVSKPTTTAAPAPASTTSTREPLTTTTTAVVAPVDRSSGPGSGSYTGDMTFYNGNGAYGACGTPVDDSKITVALNVAQFNPYTPNGNPNKNPLCGQQIQVTGPRGNSIVATIVDSCPGCGPNGIDLTPAAFNQLADPAAGKVSIKWTYL